MRLSGKSGNIYLSSGEGTPFVAEATTANSDRTVYQITDVTKRYLDPRASVTVYVDGDPVAPIQYTLAYAGGKIFFNDPQDEGAVVTVSGSSISCSEFLGCHAWNLDVSTDMIETPRFQALWKEYIEGQTGATGNFSKWFATEVGAWFLTRLSQKTPVLLLLYEYDTDLFRVGYETMAYLSKDGIQLMIEGAVDEAVDFTTIGALNYINPMSS